MGAALGIDLGTTNSVAAVATAVGVEFILGPHGDRVHPSAVAYPASGGVVVGADARALRLVDDGTVITSAKRLIGQNIRAPMVQLALAGLPYRVEEGQNQQPVIAVGDRRVTVPEVSGKVLDYLRRRAERQLGTEVTAAVITVPANFTDAQRQATKEAGRLAGLEVLRLINEPTAAALAYGFGKQLDETVCIYDFGGGTFDVSILRVHGEVFEVLASDGDPFLGGDDLDRTLAEFLAAEMTRNLRVDPRGNPGLMLRLRLAAEAVKQHLSDVAVAEGEVDDLDDGNGRVHKLPFRISRSQFESMVAGYVGRTIELCKRAMASAGIESRDLSEVVCVGGSTRIPVVRQRIAELLGRSPMTTLNPDEVVAHGAAIQAGSLSGALVDGGMASHNAVPTAATSALGRSGAMPAVLPAIARPILLDVTPASLGIATVGGYVDTLLAKNLPIPIERTRTFATAQDNQARVAIDCCRGEARRYADNEPLGQVVLDELVPRMRGEVKIDVTFRVDADGILHVRAADAETGAEQMARLAVLGAPTAPRAG